MVLRSETLHIEIKSGFYKFEYIVYSRNACSDNQKQTFLVILIPAWNSQSHRMITVMKIVFDKQKWMI